MLGVLQYVAALCPCWKSRVPCCVYGRPLAKKRGKRYSYRRYVWSEVEDTFFFGGGMVR